MKNRLIFTVLVAVMLSFSVSAQSMQSIDLGQTTTVKFKKCTIGGFDGTMEVYTNEDLKVHTLSFFTDDDCITKDEAFKFRIAAFKNYNAVLTEYKSRTTKGVTHRWTWFAYLKGKPNIYIEVVYYKYPMIPNGKPQFRITLIDKLLEDKQVVSKGKVYKF